MKLDIKTFTANNFCGIPDHEGVTSFSFCHSKKNVTERDPFKPTKWIKTKRETITYEFQYKDQYVTVEIEPIETGLCDIPVCNMDISLAAKYNRFDQYNCGDMVQMEDDDKTGHDIKTLIMEKVDRALKLSNRLPRKEPLVYGN